MVTWVAQSTIPFIAMTLTLSHSLTTLPHKIDSFLAGLVHLINLLLVVFLQLWPFELEAGRHLHQHTAVR